MANGSSGFDINAARQAGYSDAEILQHLTQSRNFNVQGALQSGYSTDEVINYLASTPPAPNAGLSPPAGSGITAATMQPSYTQQGLNPPGGFTTQGQFLANTTPEQRNRMAVAGAVGLTPAAGYLMGPGLVAAAQTPFGRELIKESAKGAGMYSAYRVARAIKNLIFGADNQ